MASSSKFPEPPPDSPRGKHACCTHDPPARPTWRGSIPSPASLPANRPANTVVDTSPGPGDTALAVIVSAGARTRRSVVDLRPDRLLVVLFPVGAWQRDGPARPGPGRPSRGGPH